MCAFILGLMKRGESWKNVIRQKGYELRVVNWGELSKAWSFTFLSVSLGGKESLFPWVEGGHLSHECLRTCSRGKSVFPACAVSPISIKKYLVCQDAIFGGSMSWTPSPPSLESIHEKEKGKTSSAEWPLDVRKTTAAGCSALPVLTGKCKVILSICPGRKPLHSAN